MKKNLFYIKTRNDEYEMRLNKFLFTEAQSKHV